MRTFIAPFRTAASVHPRSRSRLPRRSPLSSPAPSPSRSRSLSPAWRASPRFNCKSHLVRWFDGIFSPPANEDDHRRYRRLSSGVNFSPCFFAAHRHLSPDGRYFGCPRLIMRTRGTAEKRRSSTRCPFPRDLYYFLFFFPFSRFVFPLSAHFPRGFNFTLVNNDTK